MKQHQYQYQHQRQHQQSRKRPHGSLRQSSSVLLVCALSCIGCHSFPTASFVHNIPRSSTSETNIFATRGEKTLARPSATAVKNGVRKTTVKGSRITGDNFNDKRRNRTTRTSNNSRGKKSPSSDFKRYQMLEHEILTAAEEQSLGRKVKLAIQVKEKMGQLVELKQQQQLELAIQSEKQEELYLQEMTAELLLGPQPAQFDQEDGDADELEGLSVYGLEQNALLEFEKNSLSTAGTLYSTENNLWDGSEDDAFEFSTEAMMSSSSEDVLLTEQDIVETLEIPGGREALRRILIDGALARDKMISSNVRLVVSIAKKWCQQSASASGDANDHRLTTLYAGSWTRPSLDEAIQEGILGLAAAADRFEPERKLKFGTYATYWIASFVRKSFQRAATGVLRIPPHYHVVKQQYQKIVKKQYETDGTPATTEDAARELGLTAKRLEFILKSTQTLVSIDAPSRGAIPGQGGKAGADDGAMSDNSLLLAHSLSCDEPQPEDQVEMSLLRQCLENAMATELSPHERDVLRMRHGLDDGVSRSARQVVELCGGSLSVSDVRSAELRAFRKLRSPYSVHTFHLLGFLDYVGADVKTAKPLVKPRRKRTRT